LYKKAIWNEKKRLAGQKLFLWVNNLGRLLKRSVNLLSFLIPNESEHHQKKFYGQGAMPHFEICSLERRHCQLDRIDITSQHKYPFDFNSIIT